MTGFNMRRRLPRVKSFISAFSYSHGNATPCPFEKHIPWCVVEIAEIGYVAVRANPLGGDTTEVNVWLVPRNGVEAAWSSPNLSVVDREGVLTLTNEVLKTSPVVGGYPRDEFKDRMLVLYGGRTDTQVVIRPSIRKAELRFPPVISGGQSLVIPPIQYTDEARMPFVFFFPFIH